MDNETLLEQYGRLFYIVNPSRTTFKRYGEIPNYAQTAVPHLLSLFFLEICVSIITKRHSVRFNDAISCLSHGLFMEFMRIFVSAGSLLAYHQVYKDYRLVTLPLDSLWTWLICMLTFDFFYYWGHRTVHEVNFLWATHVVHHSSEDFNISTNARQSILQYFGLWVFNLPMALFIPGPMYLVHAHFSYLYQFWIHTELIGSLGPLEYIFVTPSHHRVHHGRNKNCIDKNYGGTLIIWDRLFGTFQWEKEGIHYGLTDPVNSFDFFKIQFDYCLSIWNKFWSQKGIQNKLWSLLKGPGWSPGKPRCGLIEDVPEVKGPVNKHDVKIPLWSKMYILWHFLLLVQSHSMIIETYKFLPGPILYGASFFQILSLACIGYLLDKRSFYPVVEFIRCSLYFALNYYFSTFPIERKGVVSTFSMAALQSRWFSEHVVLMTYWLSILMWLSCFIIEGSFKANDLDFCFFKLKLRKPKEKI